MEINQERYSALIEMGWEEYQRGDATRMASLLKQSLEYTPYLRVETISDWVSRFGRFALEGEQEFDADYLSDLDEWNQLLFLTLTLDLKQQTLVSTQDEEKNKEKSDRDALYYIFDNQVSRKLTDKAAWVTVSVSPDSHYSCQGNIGSEKDVPKQALVQIQFLNRSKELIQGRYEGLEYSGSLGAYEYLYPTKDFTPFEIKFYVPEQVSYVRLGFRTWHNWKPIMLGSEIKITKLKSASWMPKFKYPEPQPKSRLVIATLLDIFSESCFKYEVNIIPVDKVTWKKQFEQHKPSFFFAESIWQGNSGNWVGSMTKYAEKESNPLRDILNYCKEVGIATVFWNKEDPPNFDVFIDTAKDFDYIFTTDENCIDKYQEICDHTRVYSLPFVAQPIIHHPGGRKNLLNKVFFAGSWFNHKHHERRALMRILLDGALEKGIHIFDRYLSISSKDERYRFPEKYQSAIVGTLSYEQMLSAYRSYKAILNVNTVVDSPTMFSRRVLEALACGTPVISTPSIGMEKMLGDFVQVTHNETETNQHINRLLTDEPYRQRLAHLGYRHVHQNYTYKNSLNYIFTKLEIISEGTETQPLISVITAINRPQDLDNCLQNYARQAYQNRELLLILDSKHFKVDEVKPKVIQLPNVRVFEDDRTLGECLNLGVDNAKGEYITKCDSDDFYGSNFLSDLVLPFTYTDAAIVGKWTHHMYLEGSDKLIVRFPGNEHKYVKLVMGTAMILKREVFTKVRFPHRRVGEDTVFLRNCTKEGFKIWSTDKYNFVQKRGKELDNHTWKIADEEVLSKSHEFVSERLDLEKVFI